MPSLPCSWGSSAPPVTPHSQGTERRSAPDTGARRGELLGLKWSAVDYSGNRIHIENNILYAADWGIYEDTPKTETSVRWVTLPAETMALLKTWKAHQDGERLRLGEYYQDRGFVFAQENGQPMHPDGVTDWMKKFASCSSSLRSMLEAKALLRSTSTGIAGGFRKSMKCSNCL